MKAEPRRPDTSVNVSKTHPLREAGVLLGGAMVLAVFVFAVAGFFVDLAVRFVPIDSESRFFGAIAGRFGERWEQSPALDTLVTRLSAHWEANPYAFRTGILEWPAPNAFALPGGMILVTRGLLEQAESENELAFVIAHEIGHFRGRDHLRALGRQALLQMLLGAMGLGRGDAASHVASLGALLGSRSFSRQQELDADSFALGILHREYGHVGGAAAFFGRLERDLAPLARSVEGFASTHPLSDERTAALSTLAERNGWTEKGPFRPALAVHSEAIEAAP